MSSNRLPALPDGPEKIQEPGDSLGAVLSVVVRGTQQAAQGFSACPLVVWCGALRCALR